MRLLRTVLVLSIFILPMPANAEPTNEKWWPDDVDRALAKAKENRPELERALTKVPKDQRQGMAFLIANMPGVDLSSLKADFLLANTKLAYKARRRCPGARTSPWNCFSMMFSLTRMWTRGGTSGDASFTTCACRS